MHMPVGYLDDVTLGGAPLIIASDVELIKDKAKQYGLTLNISKNPKNLRYRGFQRLPANQT